MYICKKQWYSHDFHLYLFHYIEFETNHQSLSCIYTPVSCGTCTYEDGTAMHRSFGLLEEFRSIEIWINTEVCVYSTYTWFYAYVFYSREICICDVF